MAEVGKRSGSHAGKYGIVYEATMMDSSNRRVALKRIEKRTVTQQDVKNVMVVKGGFCEV